MTVGGEAGSHCPNCGALNPAHARFCNSCAAPLEAAPRPYEERKLISVLFVDLVAFTTRADRADPEDVRELLHLYHSVAKQRIEQYGGVLEKFIGGDVGSGPASSRSAAEASNRSLPLRRIR